MSNMEMKPLLGQENKEGTPVQETSGNDPSQVAGSQAQGHVQVSASSTQSSPSSVNESIQETSNSDPSQVAGSQAQGNVTGSASSTQRSLSSENESIQGTSSTAQSQSPGSQRQGRDIAGNSMAGNVGPIRGTQAQGSGTRNSQMTSFNGKKCIKFLPSRKALRDYEDIIQQNPNYERKNIKCRCGLAFKDHETDESLPLLYPTVKGLIIVKDMSVAEFTTKVFRGGDGEGLKQGYKWNSKDLFRKSQMEREMSLKHTMTESPGAEIGDIQFLIDDNLKKPRSQFTRLSDATEMNKLMDFLKKQWKLCDPMPELIISIVGSTQNKDLADSLVKSIIKISKFVNLIIITSGLENDLVAKKIGDAVTKEQRWTTENNEEVAARSRIKCVGITSWGALKGKERPVLKENETDIYYIPENEESNGHSCVLNPGHKYFLLVDMGTTWKQSQELNKFRTDLLKKMKGMKDDLPNKLNMLNLVLGSNKEAKYTIAMAGQLLKQHFPVIFLKHSGKYLDILADSVLQFQEEECINMLARATNEGGDIASLIEDFLQKQVQQDYQKINVMIVCDLLDGERNPLISAMLKALTQPLIKKAKVNAGKPDNNDVLQVVDVAVKLRYWETYMEELFKYRYCWEGSEKEDLKSMFKNCLHLDMPRFFPKFIRSGWLQIEEFLTVGMLAELYRKAVVNDPIQVVFERGRFRKAEEAEARLQNLKKMIENLKLPKCFLPDTMEKFQYPLKELLIWAVLSKKWHMVDFILYSQKDDNLLVWYLATAYLCRTVAARQLDMEIRSEFKDKQKIYEQKGKEMLEILHIQHEVTEGNSFTHLSLQEPSKTWGNTCPADLALLGNFKTFARSEGFHKYIVKKWEARPEGCFCAPWVKFYTHWLFYTIMVLSFCGALVSRVQHSHIAHQIWLLLWIFSYIIGEVYTRTQQQKNVRFCTLVHQHLLVTTKKYFHLLLLSGFLIGGFGFSWAGSAHWGAMLYGTACLILILIIAGHFLASFRVFAPQIAILKRAFREIFTFMVLILLLIWSVAMIFNAVLCLDDNIMDYPKNSTETTVSRSWNNWGHTVWFLYLSLYGEYLFDLDLTDEGHFTCMKDQNALMWVSYFLIGVHILIGNVLLMNLLVSIISTKADDLKSDLVYQWKSNWYKLTLHYEAQTILPPPFNMFELLVRLVCHCRQCKRGQDQTDTKTVTPSKTILNLYQYQQEANGALRGEITETTL